MATSSYVHPHVQAAPQPGGYAQQPWTSQQPYGAPTVINTVQPYYVNSGATGAVACAMISLVFGIILLMSSFSLIIPGAILGFAYIYVPGVICLLLGIFLTVLGGVLIQKTRRPVQLQTTAVPVPVATTAPPAGGPAPPPQPPAATFDEKPPAYSEQGAY